MPPSELFGWGAALSKSDIASAPTNIDFLLSRLLRREPCPWSFLRRTLTPLTSADTLAPRALGRLIAVIIPRTLGRLASCRVVAPPAVRHSAWSVLLDGKPLLLGGARAP